MDINSTPQGPPSKLVYPGGPARSSSGNDAAASAQTPESQPSQSGPVAAGTPAPASAATVPVAVSLSPMAVALENASALEGATPEALANFMATLAKRGVLTSLMNFDGANSSLKALLSQADEPAASETGVPPQTFPSSTPADDSAGQSWMIATALAGSAVSETASFSSQGASSPATGGLSLDEAQAAARQVAATLSGAGPSASGSQMILPATSGRSLLNLDFLQATRDFAATLLNSMASGASSLFSGPSANANGSSPLAAPNDSDGGILNGKLAMLLNAIDQLSGSLSKDGQTQMTRLNHFVKQIQQAYAGGQTGGASPVAPRQNSLPAQAAVRGFTFEIEVRQSTQVDATVARLTAGGAEVVHIQAASESVTRLRVTVGGQSREKSADPIVLDLNRDGQINLSATADGKGQSFDINADGQAEQTSFVAGGDGLLAIDLNHDGQITSGAELFGDQRGAANGMEELARYDDNHDGKIDSKDKVFANLVALQDGNGDGVAGAAEFRSLADLGVKSLDLGYTLVQILRPDQNVISGLGQMEFSDGTVRPMDDVDLTYK